MVFESVAVRDKYYPTVNGNTTSDAIKLTTEKMKVMDAALSKYLISGARTTNTDWIIK